jgi:hypothetical protein
MSPGVAGGIEPRFWRLVEVALRGPCEDLQLRTDLRNLYQSLVRYACWRATE